MMSASQNETLTRVGPASPGGRLLRHYWQPIALREELDALQDGVSRPIIAVRILGQDLVLFRDGAGQIGLLDRDCPHRGADLSFARHEPDGIRCPFHGWLFDASGQCLQTPGEPTGSRLCERIRQRSYPVQEKNGVIFAWLGDNSPTTLPALDCFNAPSSHTFAFKGLWECNWLQALEVGIDPAHASFLHRFFDDDEHAEYGQQFRSYSANSDLPMTRVMREVNNPEISIEATDFGMRLLTLRPLPDGKTHVRVTNQLFPHAFVLPMSETMTISQWHAPVDDTHCYWYAIFTSFSEPVDKQLMREQRLKLHRLPDYAPRVNRHNHYGFNAAEQAHRTFTGMGDDINVHDQWAVESPGAIQDRTREHLGTTDKAIIANRRALLTAIKTVANGGPAPFMMDADCARAITGPATLDGICEATDPAGIEQYWRRADLRRRQGAPWAITDPSVAQAPTGPDSGPTQ